MIVVVVPEDQQCAACDGRTSDLSHIFRHVADRVGFPLARSISSCPRRDANSSHECGHQAFSTSKTLNNTIGWVVHSSLLVPYHAWRISHSRHHASTGSLTRDEVFVPRTRKERKLPEAANEDEIVGIK